ncbi:hypothetical protein ACFPL7_02990 [Dongia soli]|uniref:Uncharacterized protein n=1 Tax=Dongia soli TaxID=600628 RepID=A0ABU5EKI9_9PROT|nr:hypothetical protein [Dongia soli]MDY0885755.1 hypothetical protein [Dongia soli]
MIGNPEFTRNLWLQFSWQRVLAAVVVIGILYYAGTATGEFATSTMANAGRWIFNIIIGFWGTRRAADALAEEVAGNTWETQRMSGLSAWQMVWGKLLGGTAYPWFCALLCLALTDIVLLQAGANASDLLILNLDLILSGLLAHAVSLGVALLLLRKAQLRRRLMVTFAQICGLLVYGNTIIGDLNNALRGPETVVWFGNAYHTALFHLVSLAVFCAWAWFGLYRLMRAELQYSNVPWVWCAFLAFAMIYAAGLADQPGQTIAAILGAPVGLGVILVYGSFLAEPKDAVRYRWGLAAFRQGNLAKALTFLPLWLITYVVTALLALVLIALLPAQPTAEIGQTWLASWWQEYGPHTRIMLAAGILFVARDLLFLLLLNFGQWRQRADIAGILYLLIAYFPLAWIVAFVGGPHLLSLVLPYDSGNAVLTFGPVLVQVAVLAVFVRQRWRAQAVPAAIAAA